MSIKRTVNHDEIRHWVEAHGGRPTTIHMSDERPGVVRFSYNAVQGPWKPMLWEDFFACFEERRLAFVYEDDVPHGEEERMTKLVNRGALAAPTEERSLDRIA